MTATYRFGDFILTASTRELRRGDATIAISPRAFDCLAYLLAHRDRAVGKDELVAAIWERVDVSDTQLGQTVLRARRAVNDDGQTQNVIRTVSRFGYRWVADVAIEEGIGAHAFQSNALIPTAPAVVPSEEVADNEISSSAAPQSTQVAQPHRPLRRVRARNAALIAVPALVLMLAAALLIAHALKRGAFDPSAAHDTTAALVLPMQVDAQAGDAWLRLGAMDLVAERLRGGGLAVPPSENTVALMQGRDARADTTIRALRGVAPTALIVGGAVVHADDRWTVALRAVAADGAVLAVESTQRDALDAARDATDRLLGRLGRAHPPVPSYASGVEERLQRAQAAMLANDLDTARAILVSDPAIAHAEPELGYRLAMVDFRAGAYARAEASLTSLLAETDADPLFRARVLDGRGAVRIRQDNYRGAESDYDAALALLKEDGNAAERGRALTGRGVSRAMRRDFAPAQADLAQARVQLAQDGDVLAIARVDTDQAALEMNRDRPQDALHYLDDAAAVFERYGAINELMETLESLVSNDLVLLQPGEALAASDRSWALATRVTDPNQRMNLIEDRVDAFLALGRLHDADALLSTLPDDATSADPFVARRLPALRARVALVRGDYAKSAEQATRALAMPSPSDDAGEGVAESALVYQRAELALAARDASAIESAPASRWIDFGKAPAYPVQALAQAEWAAWRDDASAAGLFQHALAMAEARGEPADVAAVTTAYGPWLLAQGRLREAGEAIGRVAAWAERDYDSAVLQVRLFHALGQREAWAKALAQARDLAGERDLPGELLQAPARAATIVSSREP